LEQLRIEAGLSRGEVARRVGVWDSASVSAWERGRQQPAPANVPLLAAALGVAPLELFDVPGTPSVGVLRRAAGLTLMELAQKAGLAYVRCQRIEKGLFEPTADDIQRLAAALGETVQRVEAAVRATAHAEAAATRKPSTSEGP
jgi:transcriptional regulator with XRE-family HTH domain